MEPPGPSIVIAGALGPTQSHGGKRRLLRGVYPELSRRARNDGKEKRKALLRAFCRWPATEKLGHNSWVRPLRTALAQPNPDGLVDVGATVMPNCLIPIAAKVAQLQPLSKPDYSSCWRKVTTLNPVREERTARPLLYWLRTDSLGANPLGEPLGVRGAGLSNQVSLGIAPA